MSLLSDIHEMTVSGESTARSLIRHFQRQGIGRGEIDAARLRPLYTELRSIPHASRDLCLVGPALEQFSNPLPDPVCGVIVETRRHRALEFVVNTFADHLDIPIQLFHGSNNGDFIRETSISRLLDDGRVRLYHLAEDALDARHYNALLLSKQFWNAMAGREKVLVFQTDSVICSASPYTLADFAGFDYIGSRWRQKRPIGIHIDGGSGGLSIRDWKSSVRCLEKFPPQFWPGGEDGYFAFHLDLLGHRVGRPHDCARFSSQRSFDERSFGAHRPGLMSESNLGQFLEYCPEARAILKTSASR